MVVFLGGRSRPPQQVEHQQHNCPLSKARALEGGRSSPPTHQASRPTSPRRLGFMHTHTHTYTHTRATATATAGADMRRASIVGVAHLRSRTGRVAELKPWQIINHFPDMAEICRKDLLARNVARMQEQFPGDFAFLPRTWVSTSTCSPLHVVWQGKD